MGIDVGADECDIIIKLPERGTNDNLSSVHCYPNPFFNFTTLEYDLEQSATVNLSIFNHFGQLVAMLADGKQAAGKQKMKWDAEEMPTGIYFYRLTILRASPSGQANDQRLMTTTGKLIKY